MKRLLCVVLSLAMLLSLSACGGGDAKGGDAPTADKPVEFKLSHYRAAGAPADIDANKFADAVKAATNGAVNVKVYPAAQLGDYTVVQELVSAGDVEMQMATLGTTVDKFLGMTSAPYIASNWDEAYAIFNYNSEFTKMVSDHMDKQNLKLLAVYPLYFGGVILDRELADPANIDESNGIKIRCQSMKGSQLMTEMLGYIATPMALADCFTAMQTGVINGIIGSGAEGYWSNYRDLAKYYYAYNDHFECWYLYVNKDKFNALTADQQKAMQDAAAQLEKDRWEVAPKQTEEYEAKLAGNGTDVVKFTKEELAYFAEKCNKEVWTQLTDIYGQEAIDLVAKLRIEASSK